MKAINRQVQNDIKMTLTNPYEKYILIDNGGRRTGGDRRSFSYSVHLPERREKDRRSGKDRRRFPRYKCF